MKSGLTLLGSFGMEKKMNEKLSPGYTRVLLEADLGRQVRRGCGYDLIGE